MKRPILPLFAFLLMFVVSCGHLASDGPYKGDKFLYETDNTIVTSFEMLHSFVSWEYSNRTILAGHPEIKASADVVRKNAKRWRDSAIALRKAYAANPTQENKDALTTSIKVIQTALTEATSYIATPVK